MEPQILNLIKEIDLLWHDVYPHLALHIRQTYGRDEGRILEIGPFCGTIFDLCRQGCGSAFIIGAFPSGMADFFRKESKRQGLAETIGIVETDASLAAFCDKSVDLAIFRGALFFPSLFQTDFRAIDRILKPGGLALVGGGFGKLTPEPVINAIARRSRDLNLSLGKIEVKEEDVRKALFSAGLAGRTRIITEGGLWVIIRKA
jgi:SAM-dependent methyltransferase